ncbi:MAG TPA: hypothetical protein VFQ13_07375, partial [Anaerolineales bacterium]|nr:hypothetical protein [Anaerolineales bacterium]
MKQIVLIALLVVLLTSCSTHEANVPTLTTQPQATATPSLPVDVTPASPTVSLPTPQPVVLFEQGFEMDPQIDMHDFPDFQLVTGDDGNHFVCNQDSSNYQHIYFGANSWADYAVELRVKALAYQDDPYVNVNVRLDNSGQTGYYGSLGFGAGIHGLAFRDPYQNFGDQYLPTELERWYSLRVEALHDRLSYYIDDRLIAQGTGTQRSQGRAGFMTSPHTQVCIDEIRIWALTETGLAERDPDAHPVTPEVVTADADPNNAWGGHQARIVRTKDGVFTAYVTTDRDEFHMVWHLVWRRGANDWQVLAEGDAGDDPVQLLASPDGTLHVIGWPGGAGTMWSGKPDSGSLDLSETRIPGVHYGSYSYHAAGIDAAGNICVVTSEGGGT